MHYILLAHKVDGGGIQTVVRSQAELLVQEGHHVTVVCNKELPKIKVDTYEVKLIEFQTWYGRWQLKNLFETIKEFRVLAHTFDAYWAMFWFFKYRDVVFNFVHTDYFAKYYKNKTPLKNFERSFNYRLLFNNKNVAFVSEGARESMLNKIGIKPKNTSVVYPPINFKKIEKDSLENPGIDLPENFYISLGRLSRNKNVRLAVRAFSKVCNEKDFLVIVGSGDDLDFLKRLVNQLKLNNQVVFTGWQQNPYPILKRAKMLIMSSDIEGFGLNIVESLSLGVPVVSTDAPSGPREILGHIYSDCLAKVGCADSLAQKIESLRAHQADVRFRPEELKSYVRRFDVNEVGRKLIDFTH